MLLAPEVGVRAELVPPRAPGERVEVTLFSGVDAVAGAVQVRDLTAQAGLSEDGAPRRSPWKSPALLVRLHTANAVLLLRGPERYSLP